jgi:DNA-binding NarL/FixJ family response regulator
MPVDSKRPAPRELDIARLVAAGFANKEIAANLGISEGTIKVYLNKFFKKLGLTSRLQLALWARGKGMELCFPEDFNEPKP